mgnify:CR=1 FL=1
MIKKAEFKPKHNLIILKKDSICAKSYMIEVQINGKKMEIGASWGRESIVATGLNQMTKPCLCIKNQVAYFNIKNFSVEDIYSERNMSYKTIKIKDLDGKYMNLKTVKRI